MSEFPKQIHPAKVRPLSQKIETAYLRAVSVWEFPEMGVPQNEWFIVDNPTSKMDDLGVALF